MFGRFSRANSAFDGTGPGGDYRGWRKNLRRRSELPSTATEPPVVPPKATRPGRAAAQLPGQLNPEKGAVEACSTRCNTKRQRLAEESAGESAGLICGLCTVVQGWRSCRCFWTGGAHGVPPEDMPPAWTADQSAPTSDHVG
eukprot:g12406.t1